jgi:hypothetical protein
MDEKDFIESLDCNFPYTDKSAWKKLVQQGCEISSDAAFAVLHEICRPPSNAKVAKEQLREMADYWLKYAALPLVSIVFKVAQVLIDGNELPTSETIKIMDLISKHKNEYNALAIAYFSCDDKNGDVDKKYNEIISSWVTHNN